MRNMLFRLTTVGLVALALGTVSLHAPVYANNNTGNKNPVMMPNKNPPKPNLFAPPLKVTFLAAGPKSAKQPDADGSYLVGGNYQLKADASSPTSAKKTLGDAKTLSIVWAGTISCGASGKTFPIKNPVPGYGQFAGNALVATQTIATNYFQLSPCANMGDPNYKADVTYTIQASSYGGGTTTKLIVVHYVPSVP